jgi:hypothetical protein
MNKLHRFEKCASQSLTDDIMQKVVSISPLMCRSLKYASSPIFPCSQPQRMCQKILEANRTAGSTSNTKKVDKKQTR